jgi:hypothetical protein
MRADLHSLHTDIKAAARIGHAESLWVALDGLFDLPEVAGNPPMQLAFIRQAILPIGTTLASPRISAPMLQPLARHDHAAIRALAAVAYASRYFSDEQASPEQLAVYGRDPRKDVRLALVLAFSQAGKGNPDKFAGLIHDWIEGDSPRLQAVALQLLPSLAEDKPNVSMTYLSSFQPSGNPEVRASLVDCLVELAQGNLAEDVLNVLAGWTEGSGNNLWVIGKTLSRSWVVPHATRGLEILTQIVEQHGPEKRIIKTLKAMERHGAEEAIAAYIALWKQASNPNLVALAEEMSKKAEK